ncbi:MAG: aminotransferase class V-fold PLP-dependent enzyme, partial [Xenococcaceae cyanobacterium]
NVAGIVALGEAAKLAQQHLASVTWEKRLRDKLERGILNSIPNTVINGDPVNRLPNTTNIGFKYIEGEAILLSLDQFGICASSGSACTSGSLEPSHVLRALGLPYSVLHGSIRFSLSRFTTEQEIDRVLEVLPGIIERLRELSPFNSDDADWLKEQEEAVLAR